MTELETNLAGRQGSLARRGGPTAGQVSLTGLSDGSLAWLKSYSARRSDPEHEAAALDLVGRLLGRRVVPQVLGRQPERLLLSDVSGGRPSLYTRTRAGQASPQEAFRLGHALCQLHRGHHSAPLRSLLPGAAAQQERWTQRVLGAVPEAGALLRASERVPQVLVHGNPAPSDFYVGPEELRFVDLEDAGLGDPARDLGLLLARWGLAGAELSLFNPFLRAYSPLSSELSCRAARYVGLGLCLDAPEERGELRDLGARLLQAAGTPLDVAMRTACYLRG